MKFNRDRAKQRKRKVITYVGELIEVCKYGLSGYMPSVITYVGERIEVDIHNRFNYEWLVITYVGVWIEVIANVSVYLLISSHHLCRGVD